MSNIEAIVLGDINHNFTYIFIRKDGFNLKEPPKYTKGTPNEVSFANSNVKLYKIDNIKKKRPEESLSSSQHTDTRLYYYKQKEHKLMVFELFVRSDRIKYEISEKPTKGKFFLVKNIVFYANDKPTSEEIDEEFVRIINEAIAIANEKVQPVPPIESVMF